MVDQKYKGYLLDVGLYIRERAEEAKAQRDSIPRGPERDFDAGRVLAFAEVIGIMQPTADGFDIPLHELSLQDLDPDRDWF